MQEKKKKKQCLEGRRKRGGKIGHYFKQIIQKRHMKCGPTDLQHIKPFEIKLPPFFRRGDHVPCQCQAHLGDFQVIKLLQLVSLRK